MDYHTTYGLSCDVSPYPLPVAVALPDPGTLPTPLRVSFLGMLIDCKSRVPVLLLKVADGSKTPLGKLNLVGAPTPPLKAQA